MKAKLWILVFGTAFAVFIFHHALRAEESPSAASNVFLDEGEADYEMPKVDADKNADVKTETKVTSKKSKKKEPKSPRVPAAKEDDDDDKAATGTKGDAFDQMQNPEAAQVPAEKKVPAKANKKSEDLSAAPALPKKTVALKSEPTSSEVAAPAAMTILMKPTQASTTRVPASSSFKQGFKSTKEGDCVMYADADKTSAQVLVVKGSKKLWVEESGEFFKAYHKKGSGYLPAECFE